MTRSAPLRRLASALLLAVLARPAAAGIDRFTPTGPLNSNLAALVIDPSAPGALLALTIRDGVFSSADGGHTWTWSGAGLDMQDGLQGMIGDPSTPGSVYVFTNTKVFHGADAGRHWAQVAAGQDFSTPLTPHSHPLPHLALLPGGPGAPPILFVTGFESVQRSGDGGVTWSTVFTTPFLASGWRPVADPIDPLRVWLNPPGGGLLLSENSGLSWGPVASFPAPQSILSGVLVLPTQPVTILAATGSVLWKSSDDGTSWRPIPQGVIPVAYETQTPSFVYGLSFLGTLSVSADAGETWTPRPVAPPGFLFPLPGTRALYALGPNDLSLSPDRGRHWSLVTAGGLSPLLPVSPPFPTRLRFSAPATVYAITGARAFRSTDGGASWASFAADLAPLQSTVAQDLVIDPGNPAVLYLAIGQGLFHSADAGAHWDQLTPQSFPRLDFAGRTLLGAGCGIERSTNGGRSFRVTLPCPNPGAGFPRSITRLTVDPRNSNTVYAAGFDVSPATVGALPHVWQSLDNGASWKVLLPDGNIVAVDPTRSGRLYAVRPSGLERSDDNGRTFRPISNFPADAGLTVSALLVDPATPTTLYAGIQGQGVWRSTDRGATWAPVAPRLDVQDLVLHPTVPHRVYAVGGDGLFQSRFTEP